jgi:hypothetical protein
MRTNEWKSANISLVKDLESHFVGSYVEVCRIGLDSECHATVLQKARGSVNVFSKGIVYDV